MFPATGSALALIGLLSARPACRATSAHLGATFCRSFPAGDRTSDRQASDYVDSGVWEASRPGARVSVTKWTAGQFERIRNGSRILFRRQRALYWETLCLLRAVERRHKRP
jgi:hypothetical protein